MQTLFSLPQLLDRPFTQGQLNLLAFIVKLPALLLHIALPGQDSLKITLTGSFRYPTTDRRWQEFLSITPAITKIQE
jgi:hypothetical protein